MNRSIVRHMAALAVVGVVVLSACSSDGGTDSGASTPAATGADTSATATPTADTAAPTAPTVQNDTVVATDGDAAGTAAPPADASGGLTISEFTFSAAVVTANTPFTITNKDGFAHTVSDRDGAFDVRVEGGTTETLTIERPGTYEIFCHIHPSMSGTITVG